MYIFFPPRDKDWKKIRTLKSIRKPKTLQLFTYQSTYPKNNTKTTDKAIYYKPLFILRQSLQPL